MREQLSPLRIRPPHGGKVFVLLHLFESPLSDDLAMFEVIHVIKHMQEMQAMHGRDDRFLRVCRNHALVNSKLVGGIDT